MRKQCIFQKVFFSLALVCLGAISVSAAPIEVDPALKTYRKVGGISGSLSSVGSDTLNNLMTFWAEKFGNYYPNVNIQVEGKGSSTAPPALISATSQLGPMSRAMKAKSRIHLRKNSVTKLPPFASQWTLSRFSLTRTIPLRGCL